MGLAQQEIKELRLVLNDVKNRRITHENLMDEMIVYSQIEKRARLILDSITLSAKYGNGVANKIIASNIVGHFEAIDITPEAIGNQLVQCEILHKSMSREECLDLSGDLPEGYDCSGCQHYTVTRNALIGQQ
jgi:hypothetical protein